MIYSAMTPVDCVLHIVFAPNTRILCFLSFFSHTNNASFIFFAGKMQLSLRFAVAALAVFSTSDVVLAGHLRRAHRGSSAAESLARRDGGGAAPAVTEAQLQQLQGYLTMYENWFNGAVSQLPATDPAAEQLKAQHEQYSSAIKQWMSTAMGGSKSLLDSSHRL